MVKKEQTLRQITVTSLLVNSSLNVQVLGWPKRRLSDSKIASSIPALGIPLFHFMERHLTIIF